MSSSYYKNALRILGPKFDKGVFDHTVRCLEGRKIPEKWFLFLIIYNHDLGGSLFFTTGNPTGLMCFYKRKNHNRPDIPDLPDASYDEFVELMRMLWRDEKTLENAQYGRELFVN